jgi:hypothetical protein
MRFLSRFGLRPQGFGPLPPPGSIAALPGDLNPSERAKAMPSPARLEVIRGMVASGIAPSEALRAGETEDTASETNGYLIGVMVLLGILDPVLPPAGLLGGYPAADAIGAALRSRVTDAALASGGAALTTREGATCDTAMAAAEDEAGGVGQPVSGRPTAS